MKSLGTTFASYFIGSKVLANFAYRGIYDGIGYFVVLLTMLFTFVTDFGMTEKTYDAQMKRKILMMKIWNAVLIFGTACLVWTALYLDFTPVLSLIFINQKVRCSMNLENYQSLIAFLMLIGTGISIYCLMLA